MYWSPINCQCHIIMRVLVVGGHNVLRYLYFLITTKSILLGGRDIAEMHFTA